MHCPQKFFHGRLSDSIVGADVPVRPSKLSVFTKCYGKSGGSRRADVGIAPYMQGRKLLVDSPQTSKKILLSRGRTGSSAPTFKGAKCLRIRRRFPRKHCILRGPPRAVGAKKAPACAGAFSSSIWSFYTSLSFSKKLFFFGWLSSPLQSSSFLSSSFCSRLRCVGVSTTTVTYWSPRVL